MRPMPIWGAVLMTAVVALVWWTVAATTAIGDVVLVLPGPARGLHEGDLAAAAVAAPVVVVTWMLARPRTSER